MNYFYIEGRLNKLNTNIIFYLYIYSDESLDKYDLYLSIFLTFSIVNLYYIDFSEVSKLIRLYLN